MSKKIRIDLDDDHSINEAIREIEELKEMIDEFPAYVARREYLFAQERYDNVTKNDGELDVNTMGKVSVMCEEQPKKALIHAVGEDVVFAEYGAGIGTPEVDTTANGGEMVTTGQGTWSQSGGKGHIPLTGDRGYWFYYNTYYKRINPTYAMTQTVEDIKRDAGKLSQEFFK